MTLFANRAEAGQMLAAQLQDLQGKDAIVLAVSAGRRCRRRCRGALVGRAARCVHLAQGWRRRAMKSWPWGAVASDGTLVLDATIMRDMNVTQRYIQSEMDRQRGEILRRLSLYRNQRPLPQLKGKNGDCCRRWRCHRLYHDGYTARLAQAIAGTAYSGRARWPARCD